MSMSPKFSTMSNISPADGTALTPEFFRRDTLTVARELLGCTLVRRTEEGEKRLIIRETEAYDGPLDLASHASKGRTARTEVMFGAPGMWYVYFVYGIHWMLNIVTGDEGFPAAVLIRGAGEWSGPARLTKALNIKGALNRLPAEPHSGLWIEKGFAVPDNHILRTPRIGVDYAGEWAKKEYRFLIDENAWKSVHTQR